MKIIIAGSLALNFVLLSAVAYFSAYKPAPAAPEPARPALRPERHPRAVVATTTDEGAFNWSELESADFKQYMANLRAIGCPEETIRDLIVADVNKMYVPRFAALAAETQKFDFWRKRSKSKEGLTTQLRALQEEKKALLRELLGIDNDPYEKWANADVNRLREEGKYSFLSAEKQAQVRAIMEKYETLPEALKGSGRDGLLISSGNDSKRLREQRQQELAQVLSPEELKELSLRDSNTADAVRSRFGNMDLTEAEYRKLYDLRKAYEDTQGAIADMSDPEKVRQRSEARQQLNEAYKTAFGEERWNELQRQQDPTWRNLSQLAQQNNISQAVISEAWQQQRQVGEQIMRTLQDQSMSHEQRDGIVRQLTAEYDQSLRNLLGETAYQQYKQRTPEFAYSSPAGDAFTFVAPSGANGPFSLRTVTTSDGTKDVRKRIEAPVNAVR